MTLHVLAEETPAKPLFRKPKAKAPLPAPTLAQVEQIWFTEDDYLRREERALRKHEFHPTGQILREGKVVTVGRIVAMSGARPAHCRISMNISGNLYNALKGKPCQPYGSDLSIKIPATGLRTYPDISVICGPLESEDDNSIAVTNPTLLVEVLSKSTERYDRGVKWLNYQQLASLREYFLVSAKEPLVERFYRRENGTWDCERISGLDESLLFSSVGVIVGMAEVYAGVDFAAG